MIAKILLVVAVLLADANCVDVTAAHAVDKVIFAIVPRMFIDMEIKFQLANTDADSFELRENYARMFTQSIWSSVTVVEFQIKQTYVPSSEEKRTSLRLMLELEKMEQLTRIRFDRLFDAPSLGVLLNDLKANNIAPRFKSLDIDRYEPLASKDRVDFSASLGHIHELTVINSDPYCAAGYMGRLERLTIKNLQRRAKSEMLFVHNAASLQHLDITTAFDDEFLRFLDVIHLVRLKLETLTIRYVYGNEVDVVAEYERIMRTERVGSTDKKVPRMRLTTNSLARFADALRMRKLYTGPRPVRYVIEVLQVGLDGGMKTDQDPELLAEIIRVHREQLKSLEIFTMRNELYMPLIWEKIFEVAQNLPEIIIAEANGPKPAAGSSRPNDSIQVDSKSGHRRLNVIVESGRYHSLPKAPVIFFKYSRTTRIDEFARYAEWFSELAEDTQLTLSDGEAVCLERIAKEVANVNGRDPQTASKFQHVTYIRGTVQESQRSSLEALFGMPAVQVIVFDVVAEELAGTMVRWFGNKDGWQPATVSRNERGTFSVVHAKSGILFPSPEFDLGLEDERVKLRRRI